ncbi:SLC6A5 [Branchiostoma lanceolatum]|uniref:SLC6A5 protein n=1 Tax=Branchiostoma lanceolatum TaxID=7740 RepID=A0A8K0ESC7_BRALA|nr:SLC6A5 [Branchiostoma lanceolatum]
MDSIISSLPFLLRHYVLDISEGVDHPGAVKWQLALCLFLAWLLIFCCLIKGIKSSGKVVWVTATFPYIVLTILLVRGVTLEGAWDGIKFYLEPKWSKLAEPQVWRDGAIQIFFSLGTSWGQLITLSSYSRFHNNCYRDALVIAVLNCLTSFYAGFAIFSVLGFMANEMGVKVEEVADTGAGLAFVAYPAALARLPISPLWSSLFFVMLLTLGLDSQFAVLEALVTGIVDEFPRRLRSKKMFIVLGMCAIGFLLGLPLVTQGGFYLLQLMDNYSGTFSLLVVAIVECVVVGWVYGCDRFLDDISMMIGCRPCLWWKICWKFLTPLSLLFILIFQFTVYSPTKYGNYTYPVWAEVLGWCMVGVAVLMLPAVALYKVCCAKGTLYERVSFLVEPSWDWGPALDRHRDGEVYQFLHGQDKAASDHREMSDFIRTATGGDESTKI